MLVRMVDKRGWSDEFNSTDIDEYRLGQMEGRWLPAGEVFCRVGYPKSPFGFGHNAELHPVMLSAVPPLKAGEKVCDTNGSEGRVTLADDYEFCVLWDNGMTGSFKQKYAFESGVKRL